MSSNGYNPVRRAGGVAWRQTPRLRTRQRLWNQVNRNLVALISLVMAMTSLGYNTWRNETTEVQRNWRQASVRILIEVGELNQVVLMRRYFVARDAPGAGGPPQPESWVRGWGSATMIRDIASVLPGPLPARGRRLFEAWERHAEALHDPSDAERRDEAASELLEAVEQMRQGTVDLLASLT